MATKSESAQGKKSQRVKTKSDKDKIKQSFSRMPHSLASSPGSEGPGGHSRAPS